MTKENILIVDDEDSILINIKKLFERNYSLITARSAEEALVTLSHRPISVVISDFKMGGQDIWFRMGSISSALATMSKV